MSDASSRCHFPSHSTSGTLWWLMIRPRLSSPTARASAWMFADAQLHWP
jgi:hypothetical protein